MVRCVTGIGRDKCASLRCCRLELTTREACGAQRRPRLVSADARVPQDIFVVQDAVVVKIQNRFPGAFHLSLSLKIGSMSGRRVGRVSGFTGGGFSTADVRASRPW